MNIWLVDWYSPLLIEANKLWAYAICASIVATLGQMVLPDKPPPRQSRQGDEPGEAGSSALPAVTLLTRLVTDVFDLSLPASFVGWASLSDLTIGSAMVASTLLAWPEVWAKAQG